MPKQSFARCIYCDSAGIQCDVWFDTKDHPKLCILHREIISAQTAVMGNGEQPTESKLLYLARVNEITTQVSAMSLEQVDVHIAGIEQRMEDLKTELLASRAVRSNKIGALTEAERTERRKIKVEKLVNEVSKKTSIKKNPLEALVETFMKSGISREKALESAKGVLGL